MTVLETKELTKRYRRIRALQQLSIQVEQGMVFGLLGPNGSGKTTTLGILLGVLKATSGTFRWFGEPPSANSRKRIGAILETPCFYPYMTASQNLTVAARIKECPISHIEPVLETVGLYDRKDDPFRTYSLGMKQRLAIASALLSDPSVMILDEPTNGLDPQGIVEIRELVKQIARSGKTIILASHLLDEVQKVCTHFMVLRKGEKLYQGSVQDTLADQRTVEVAAKDMTTLEQVLREFRGLAKLEVNVNSLILTTDNGIDTEAINRHLIDQGVIATMLVEHSGNLEAQFLKILSEHD